MKTLFKKTLVKFGYAVVSLLLLTPQSHAATHYFHNDHLGTPQVVTDANQQVVWKGEYDPFGKATETVALVEQNIRFPGQYFDSETELHYNYFRNYDPGSGRYMRSDPIGLNGGLSTYLYAVANPIIYLDVDGRDAFTINGSLNLPFIGGVSFGFVEFFGSGIENRDFGIFITVKEELEGSLGLAKASFGTSATVGCRSNFDGVGTEIAVGLGNAGIGIGPGKNDSVQSTSADIGFQLGVQGSLTKTFSFTIGDAARFLAKKFNGDAGSIRQNGSCECS